MQVTLRQAHKLVDKINGRLKTVTLHPVAQISIYAVGDAATLLSEKVAKHQAEQKRHFDLLSARQELRMSIQAVNAAEVNNLVAVRKSVLDELSTWRSIQLAVSDSAVSTAAELEAKLKALRETPSNGYSHNEKVEVCLLSAADLEALDKRISTLQLRVEGIEDSLTTANSVGSINISAGTEQLLRREGVIQ